MKMIRIKVEELFERDGEAPSSENHDIATITTMVLEKFGFLPQPTIRRLPLAGRVKYLSYDAVREIDDFFENTKSGLSIDVVTSKAEQLAVI
jgi:hypothetical protein